MKYSDTSLLTDLYQLTMMQSYYDWGLEEEAVFEFFFRSLPEQRPFMVACGLEQALDYLEELRFRREDIDVLYKDGRFKDDFLDRLQAFSFTGSIHGLREGSVFFANEPVLRVTAPLPQAQLVETRLINILHFQTMIASKAVRMTRIMPDKILVDYGLRRSHGGEAGVLAARAAYLAGFAATATVAAGAAFGIPVSGTMAHSFVQAHDSEEEAFYHFAISHPENCIFLLDTYNVENAVATVIRLAPRLAEQDIPIKGVRLDSGNIGQLARQVRQMLDRAGLHKVQILASGDMDEYALQMFRDNDIPIDGFGIGSKMTTSADQPCFNCAYKLVEYAGRGRRKLAEHKTTWPGRKQVFRQQEGQSINGDIVGLEGESLPGERLIHHYMTEGQRLQTWTLQEARDFLQSQLRQLPPTIDDAEYRYPVTLSEQLLRYTERID